jgi:hypothetical protein
MDNVQKHNNYIGFPVYYYLLRLQVGFNLVALYYSKTQYTNDTHHTK